jgi:hypothetical protein
MTARTGAVRLFRGGKMDARFSVLAHQFGDFFLFFLLEEIAVREMV